MTKRYFIATFTALCVAFSTAVTLAQTPTPAPAQPPTPSMPPGSPTPSPSVPSISTSVTLPTPVPTLARRDVTPTVALPRGTYHAGGGPFPFANPFSGIGRIQTLWTRTDLPVREGLIQRAWFWGPAPNTPALLERYDNAPNSTRTRLVQYFDKSRMEINDPNGNWNSDFYVTNGLLTVEMIAGAIQVGDDLYLPYRSSCLHVAGDPGNGLTPTYAALSRVSNTPFEEHPAPNRTGGHVTQTIDVAGNVGNRPDLMLDPIRITYFEGQSRHNIPRVFWDFLHSRGAVYEQEPNEFHQIVNQPNLSVQTLILPWYYATGLPISEPYWTQSIINGQEELIIIQAYERRILTYNPGNHFGFQVEMSNIGQHYFDWRYRNAGLCPGSPFTPPMPVVSAPTATIPATTPTFRPPTPSSPIPTGSVTPPTPLPIPTGTFTPLPNP